MSDVWRELLEDGRFIDLALVVIALEVVAIAIARRMRGRGLRPTDVLGQLGAGAFLLLALRCVLVGADYRWTLLCLTAAFPAHAYDLYARARAANAGTSPR